MSACPVPSSPASLHPSADAAPPVTWADPARALAFGHWLASLQGTQALVPDSLRMASADASFRRYFRIDSAHGSRIIMDAPPDKEDCAPFAHVAQVLADAGLRVPAVLAWDPSQGFMLLEDLGPATMMQALQPEQRPEANLPLYLQAVDALVQMQKASRPGVLPVFDKQQITREMELFPQWYVTRHRGVAIDDTMRRTLDQAFEVIAAECLAWPSVFVHSDFMPRNLMLPTAHSRMGVLDFQDAVYGPITYDIGSLMRDAFLSWDEDFVLDVTIRYWEKARAAGLPVGDGFRRLLPRRRMDGPAAPSARDRHLRPPDPARRQAALPGRHPPLHRLHARHGRTLPRAQAAAAPDRPGRGHPGRRRLCVRPGLTRASGMSQPPRFYCPVALATAHGIDLPAGAARHVQVLRLQPGAPIVLFGDLTTDATGRAGGEFDATVVEMGRSSVRVQVGRPPCRWSASARRIHLAIGMPANERMDWLVEKATELGAASVQALMTERTVVRLDGERARKRAATGTASRWLAASSVAATRCRGSRKWRRCASGWRNRARSRIPPVLQLLLSFRPVPARCSDVLRPDCRVVTVLAGPEGGLSAPQKNNRRWRRVSCRSASGPRVLRAETAAIAALTLLT
jgi:aminoglycoside/choline kinase family phosphotransferase/16S rRNA U1498 N3-methylase RsmE